MSYSLPARRAGGPGTRTLAAVGLVFLRGFAIGRRYPQKLGLDDFTFRLKPEIHKWN